MRRPAALSGWLYADLVLVLFVIFLASSFGGVGTGGQPASSPTAIPVATPSCVSSASLQFHDFTLPPSPNAGIPTRDQLRGVFQRFAGQRVGILLTFVHAPTPKEGDDLAAQVNDELQAMMPAMFPDRHNMWDFSHQDSGNHGQVDFDVYLLLPPCAS